MKSFVKTICIGLVSITFIATAVSCGSGRTSAITPKGNRAVKVGYNPVAKKNEPVKKKFIIHNKQRHILGTKPVKK